MGMAVYVCRRCAYADPVQWEGACPQCRGLYRANKVGSDTAEQKQRSSFAAAATSKTVYIPIGIEGLDYVFSGGLVPGNVILFGGFRGTGKSSLWVQALDVLSSRRKVLYASSEQSADGVVQIAHRVGARSEDVVVLGNQGNIEKTLATVKEERAFLTVYDSLQKFTSHTSAAAPGSAAQGTAVASAIKDDCRSRNCCAIIVNQMSRSGELRGGSDVEHDMDTVAVLAYPQDDDEEAPGNEKDGIRVLVVDKNRNGSENLKAYFRMSEAGVLERVEARSKLLEFPARGKYSRRSEEVED